MSDHNDDFPCIRYLLQFLEEFSGNDTVQSGIRLIQHEKLRIRDKLDGNGYPSQLSSGHLGYKSRSYWCESQQIHDFLDPLFPLLRLDLQGHTELGGIADRAEDRIVGADQIHLGDKSDPIFHLVVLLIHIRAVQVNIGVCFLITDNGVHKSRFSGAGASQQQDQRSVGNIHGNIFEQILLFSQFPCCPLPQMNTEAFPGCGRCIHRVADTGNLRRFHSGLPAGLKADFRVRLISFVKSQEEQSDPFSQEPQDQPSPFQIEQKDQAHKDPDSVYVQRYNHGQRD